MPNGPVSRWPFVALALLSLGLLLEILGPALAKPLWYDDLDGLMFGRLAFEGSGVDDTHPWPLDYRALDENGRNRVYQSGWIWLNALAYAVDLPHPLWRAFHVSALVLAFILLSHKRLKGWWVLVPVMAALFADLPMRVGCSVRTYNLSALGLVLFLIIWNRYDKGKWVWPLLACLTALWQLSLLALAYALAGMATSLALSCKFNLRKWSGHWPLGLFLAVLAVSQTLTGWPSDSRWFTMVHEPLTRCLSQWHTLNSQGIALVVLAISCLILAISRTPLDAFQGAFMGMTMAATLVFPFVFEAHRGIWSIMILPIVWVETSRVLSTKKFWGPGLLLLGIFTNIPAWAVSRTLPLPQANFIDKAVHSQRILKLAPAAAFHETHHRKQSQDDIEYFIISRELKREDSLLYEFSRLSLMSRLHLERGVPVTQMFPPSHPYFDLHPHSMLTQRRRPCWVLLPVGADPDLHRKKWLEDPTARVVSDTLIYLP